VERSLCRIGGYLNEYCLTRVLTSLSITYCCQDQKARPPYFVNCTSKILKLPIVLFSFVDFPGPAALPDYLHVEAFTKSLFRPFSVVTNAVETTASLALIDYLTN